MARQRDFNTSLLEDAGNYTTKIDAPDANTTYIGKSEFGTSDSTAKWQIKKISISGSVTSIVWANGDDSFSQVWSDRASLSYS